jgi:hypothetical protein
MAGMDAIRERIQRLATAGASFESARRIVRSNASLSTLPACPVRGHLAGGRETSIGIR